MPPPLLAVLAVMALLAATGSANVEKAIFLGPAAAAPVSLPDSLSAAISHLHRLTPDDNDGTWRTPLSAAFPWATDFDAKSTTWVLLDGLQPGQRYEARVCWAATVSSSSGTPPRGRRTDLGNRVLQQPTAFDVDAFSADVVLASPILSKSLTSFSDGAQNDEAAVPRHLPTSFLLLRIVATADYVAANRSLMLPQHVQPVLADIILDPFLLNVLPRSLAPTVVVVLLVAAVSAALSRHIVRWLRSVAASDVMAAARQTKSKQT
ncbi:hypothetical protein CMQ_7921 [Grosmannia clavigera kw1407]|uniref:Uncharacterized protein n=1 Tax=Grosmannia clavigera (strain kw1407 / UAMH 11150) TaxID=655863 RepID=F0XRS6_GROCL|nr:uncharacterized protein CMQ_7921 [Grosmannia clavigera kw1407]EFW99553.1 hypothetical protein CMQ_7921 [Grosmannia clavigera kw1407]